MSLFEVKVVSYCLKTETKKYVVSYKNNKDIYNIM
jgi:hypothetical protein